MMPSSRHRLTLKENRPMEPAQHLIALEELFLENRAALGRAEATIARYNASFTLFHRSLLAAHRPLTSASLTTEDLQGFATWLRATPIRPQRGSTSRSESGIHAHLRDLRAFINWLYDAEMLTSKVKIPLPRLPQRLFPILTDEELRRVWTCRYLTGRSSLAMRNRAMIGLMLDTGLRREEVASLRISDLDLDDCLLTVIGKGNKQRRVPFSTRVRQLLIEFIGIRGNDAGPLFHLSAAGIRSTFRRIAVEASLERFHPHQLRHQAATMMVRNHADLESVRRILGHADLATTAKYMSLSDEDLRIKHAAASPFDTLMRGVKPEVPATRRKRYSLVE